MGTSERNSPCQVFARDIARRNYARALRESLSLNHHVRRVRRDRQMRSRCDTGVTPNGRVGGRDHAVLRSDYRTGIGANNGSALGPGCDGSDVATDQIGQCSGMSLEPTEARPARIRPRRDSPAFHARRRRRPSRPIASAPSWVSSEAMTASMSGTSMRTPTRVRFVGSTKVLMLVTPSGPKTRPNSLRSRKPHSSSASRPRPFERTRALESWQHKNEGRNG